MVTVSHIPVGLPVPKLLVLQLTVPQFTVPCSHWPLAYSQLFVSHSLSGSLAKAAVIASFFLSPSPSSSSPSSSPFSSCCCLLLCPALCHTACKYARDFCFRHKNQFQLTKYANWPEMAAMPAMASAAGDARSTP